SFKTSYDSFPSRKSAFVPVAQNARTATNVQHQPLEVPLQPNPRPVVGAPSPPSVTSESVASNPPQPEIRPEVPQPPSDKKRFQTCRLCHNHGIIIPIRGHKYVCPYNKCTCSNCKVTLKRRHFVKEQLKITRRQNITMQNGRNSSEPVEPNSVNLQNVQIKPFPQKDVMMKDLALFDDSELFEEIDSICRPQGKGKS
ncbi:DM DNA-binding domain, partial [Trinorchestia longiramus]